MNCKEVSLLIEEFCDGELSLHLESRVKEHIEICVLCSADLNNVIKLDQLLEKSSPPPPPSVMLDQKLMEAFRDHNKAVSISPAWWQRIFVGSLSIPKPAFAAALVVFAVAVTAANLVGRYTMMPADFSAVSVALPTVVNVPLPPEIIEKTKIIEVPVVKERVVTRVVYVERQNNKTTDVQKTLLAQNQADGNKQERTVKEDDSNLAMNGAVNDDGYVTRANLIGFQPPTELKTRIIREDKTNEK